MRCHPRYLLIRLCFFPLMHTHLPTPLPTQQLASMLEHRSTAARASVAAVGMSLDEGTARTQASLATLRDTLCARGAEAVECVAQAQDALEEVDARVRATTRQEVARRTYEQIMGQHKRAGSLSSSVHQVQRDRPSTPPPHPVPTDPLISLQPPHVSALCCCTEPKGTARDPALVPFLTASTSLLSAAIRFTHEHGHLPASTRDQQWRGANTHGPVGCCPVR